MTLSKSKLINILKQSPFILVYDLLKYKKASSHKIQKKSKQTNKPKKVKIHHE